MNESKLRRQIEILKLERDEWRNRCKKLIIEAQQSPTKKWKLNKFTMDEDVYIEDKGGSKMEDELKGYLEEIGLDEFEVDQALEDYQDQYGDE